MFKFIKLLLGLLGLAVVAGVGFGIMRTMKSERSANQQAFLGGRAIFPVPGFYKGTVTGYDGSWQGKFIDEGSQRGANFFEDKDILTELPENKSRRYPFALYPAKGLRDTELEVITLDYNQPGNPWWLRFITDEIVQTGSSTYLGKVHVKITPSIVFTLGYFTLEQPVAEPTTEDES